MEQEMAYALQLNMQNKIECLSQMYPMKYFLPHVDMWLEALSMSRSWLDILSSPMEILRIASRWKAIYHISDGDR